MLWAIIPFFLHADWIVERLVGAPATILAYEVKTIYYQCLSNKIKGGEHQEKLRTEDNYVARTKLYGFWTAYHMRNKGNSILLNYCYSGFSVICGQINKWYKGSKKHKGCLRKRSEKKEAAFLNTRLSNPDRHCWFRSQPPQNCYSHTLNQEFGWHKQVLSFLHLPP